MRVLLVAGAYAPNRIGAPAVVAERTAQGLLKLGHEVIVLTAVPGPTVRYEAGGVPVLGVPPAEIAGLAPELLAMLQPDVVHQHSPRLLSDAVLRAAQAAGVPTVVSLIGAEPRIAADLTAAAHAVVVDTPDAASGERERVIPAGAVPPPAGWHRPARRGPLRFGYAGGTDDDLGYRHLLEALQALRRTDYELHVVDRAASTGAATLREWDFRVPGLVRLVPGFGPEGAAAFFGSIDVLLALPQTPGHLSLATRDAALHGVWPIATDIPANAVVVHDGVTGDLVAPGAIEALSAAISRALDAHPGDPPPALGTGIPTVADQVAALDALYADIVGAT